MSKMKGTRQAFVPGESRRTGPPGKHVRVGKSNYRILDEQVRYFVSPGAETLKTTQVSIINHSTITYTLSSFCFI